MTPIVNGLETDFSGQLTVVRLNGNDPENLPVLETYGLRGHPAFAVLGSDGQATQLFFGPQSQETLHEAISQVLSVP